jgi:hypothetical protein
VAIANMGPDQIFQDDDELKKRPLVPSIPPPSVAAPSSGPSMSVPKIGPQQSELNRLETTGSGVSQIGNPVLRGIARVGDVLGSVFAPRIAGAIPGTTMHHDQLIAKQEGLANQEAGYGQKQSQAAQEQATAGHINAETNALQHPGDKPANNEIELFQKSPEQLEQFYSAKEGHQPDKGVANPQAGYAQAIADALKNKRDPNTDPHVQAWRSAIEATQKESAGNRDDKAIAINQKLAMKQPLTPEEVAYKKAYDQYVKQNKVDPGVQRMEILTNSRMLPTVEEGGRTVYTPARQAAGKESPQSIPFQTEKGVARAFTTGKPAEELNAFNTAIAHADLLGQAATALGNGDTRALNSIRNAAKTQFGSADVTNFNTIAKIYTGEVTKAINGGHVTEGELHDVGATIPDNASPQQIVGAVKAFRQLMQSKVQQRKNQYDQGMQGQPNFGNPNSGQQGGGVIYARDPQGQLHKAPAGTQLPQGWKQEAQQ